MAIATYNDLPLYKAVLEEDSDRVLCVSFVDMPAVESDFIAFSAARAPQMYSVQDESRRRVFGVVIRANYPMLRYDADGNPFYIVFTPEDIQRFAEKYMKENRGNNVNQMHVDGTDVYDVVLCQYFIKDSAKGISPAGFEDIEDGSLFAEYHVMNDDVWARVKDGSYRGFSIEVCAQVEPVEQEMDAFSKAVLEACREEKFNTENMSRIKKILAALSEALKFGTMTTDKGVIRWEGEEPVKVGDEIEIVPAEEGAEPVKAEAGEYVGADVIVIVAEDGKVAEVKEKAEVIEEPAEDPAAEEAVEEVAEELEAEEPVAEPEAEPVAEEPAEEPVAPEYVTREELDAVKAELEALKELVKGTAEAVKENEDAVEELRKAPVSKGVKEEYKAAAAPASYAEAIKAARAARK